MMIKKVDFEEKIKNKRLFNASFLRAYKDKLSRNKKLSPEQIEKKLNLKKLKLDKKLSRLVRNHETKQKNLKKRVFALDFVRGGIIIGMFFDHFVGDFWMLTSFGLFPNYLNSEFMKKMIVFSVNYWISPIRMGIRLFGLLLLTLLIGISSSFSKSNKLRGFGLLFFEGILSVGSIIFSTLLFEGKISYMIIMGPLGAYAICILFFTFMRYIFTRKIFPKNLWKWVCLSIGILILGGWAFIRYQNVLSAIPTKYNYFWFIFHNDEYTIPTLDSNLTLSNVGIINILKVISGLAGCGIDFFPLFPWMGYVFIGGFIGETLYKNKTALLSKKILKSGISLNEKLNRIFYPIIYLGNHSIWFYLIHQVVFVIVISLIAIISGAGFVLFS